MHVYVNIYMHICIDYTMEYRTLRVDIPRNWSNRRCQLQLLPTPRFAFRDAFSNASLHHRLLSLPFSHSFSLSLSPSVSRVRASSISVVTTTESLTCQWSLTSHSWDCITDVSVPFINGTWRIENCFAAMGRSERKMSKIRHHRFYFSHDTFQSKGNLITQCTCGCLFL